MRLEVLRFVARRIAYNAASWPYDFWKEVGRITFQILVDNELLNVELCTSAFTDEYLRLVVGVDDGTEPSVTISETSEVDIYADRDEAYTSASIISLPGLLPEFSVYGWRYENTYQDDSDSTESKQPIDDQTNEC